MFSTSCGIVVCRSLGSIHRSESLWVYFKSIWNSCKNRAHKSQQVRNYSSWRTESEYLLTFKGNPATCSITNDPWNLSSHWEASTGQCCMISPMWDAPTLSRANTLIWYFCSLSWTIFPFLIHSYFLPPILPMCPPYHFHSPYVLQSVFKPLSSFHAHTMCVGIGLPTLVWVTYQDPSSWRKWTFPTPVAPTWGLESSWTLPYMC